MDVVRLGDRTLVSTGGRGGFTIDSSLAPALIESWLAQQGPALAEIRLSGWRPDQLPAAVLAEAPRLTSLDVVDSVATLALAATAAPARWRRPGARSLQRQVHRRRTVCRLPTSPTRHGTDRRLRPWPVRRSAPAYPANAAEPRSREGSGYMSWRQAGLLRVRSARARRSPRIARESTRSALLAFLQQQGPAQRGS